jgi:tRNA acetyltransferase TAN1
LITLQGKEDANTGVELMGIEEIEMALQNDEKVLNIKESNFPNVVLIDLAMEPLDAVKLLENAQTTVISKIVLIESVVRTRLDIITEKILDLAGNRIVSGDSFKVICDLRGRKYIKSREELIEKISEEIVEKFEATVDGSDADWVVQVEVVGENTGISILNPEMILKKL